MPASWPPRARKSRARWRHSESAIALDPDYAAAHAGLAVAHCAEAELLLAAPDVAYTSARAAALRALAMEASNADAQVALGTVLFLSDWNWNGARRSLERALELNADHTEGWLLYGRLLEALGYLAEGLAAKQRVLERDPSSATVHLQIALSYWNQRRYDDMIAWATRSLELDPQHLLAREYLAGAYLKKGDLDRHMAESLTHARTAGAPLDARSTSCDAFTTLAVALVWWSSRFVPTRTVHPSSSRCFTAKPAT